MRNLYLLTCILLLSQIGGLAAQRITISGYLEDRESGEKLIAANVLDRSTGLGTSTNTYGFYSLTIDIADSTDLVFSYIGYQSVVRRVGVGQTNLSLNVTLSSSVDLTVVEVNAERTERIEESTQMSRVTVPVDQIKQMPALLGEVDVLKALQLLPGVQSGGEGQSGLYVRGGSPDQNLVLLDGVPVYNVSHLLGVFSVFNADAIRNVTLTKGGFPARFGGRLSSVLEINMKEGNLREWHGEGALGLISSKLTLEGPIKRDKTSVLLSARRTYADLIFGPIARSAARDAGQDLNIGLYFYDLNAKLQHKINDQHRLFLSAYLGADVFRLKIKEDDQSFGGGTDWGNLIAAARWNWQLGPKFFANTTMTFSRYNIDIVAEQTEDDSNGESFGFSSKYRSGIEDTGAKIDFDFIPDPRHYIRFGAGYTYHAYSPGALALRAVAGTAIELDTLLGSRNSFGDEFYVYAEDDFSLGALKINAGLHWSGFAVDGEFYQRLQPRLGLRYLLNNDLALKGSFSTMTQFINLLTSESLSLPTDLWVPSTGTILPQQSWQAAVGAARTIDDRFEVSIEGFYKQMRNVISYREGATFLLGFGDDWQDKVTQGDGESYGLEFFLQKKTGRTTGWLGYTLSWNWRQFDELNSGQRFPFRYDRRHDLSLVINHELSKKVNFSAAWVYGTGNAITLPLYIYEVGDRSLFTNSGSDTYRQVIEAGGSRNDFRMSDYHRLDLSISFNKEKRNWSRSWVISVYNAYWHRNPYFVTSGNVRECTAAGCNERRVFREISILPIIPSVSYQFKF